MPGPVIVVDRDPHWPLMYEEEKGRILEAVGNKILAIEHIGSTAVPGLGAKPIIDIMAGVRQHTDADECLSPLYRIGYIDVTPQPGHTEWYYCLGKAPHSTGFHLHLVKFMSAHWQKHLVFRDFLRTHPTTAQHYYELKRNLATKYGTDRVGYTDAKTSFIESVLTQASQRNVRLLSKVYVDHSPIHDKGVFAAINIKEGEPILEIDDSRVVTNDNPLRPEKGEHKHHCDYLENGRVVHMQEPERYINHSCDPNVYVKHTAGVRYVLAIKNLNAGQEITFDYCVNGYGDEVWQCNCGSSKCRKTVHIDYFRLPREKQLEYLPYIDKWFLRENKKKLNEIIGNTDSR